MNNLALKVFDNEQFGSVRTITKDEQPWFVGVDVARALGYKIPRDAVNKKVWKQNKDICSLFAPAVSETCVSKMATQGQEQEADDFVCKMHTNSEADDFVCKIGTKSEADDFVAKIHTQGQDRDTETCVLKIGTQGQDRDTETCVPKTAPKMPEFRVKTPFYGLI